MTPTNVELYEALKPTVGEDAARMIAEVVPPTRDLATKSDIEATRGDIEATRRDIESAKGDIERLRGDTREGYAKLEGKIHAESNRLEGLIHAESTRTIKWFLGVFVPVWAGTWGSVIAVLLRS